MKIRMLALRKETLAELATDELAAVVGASHGCLSWSRTPTGCTCDEKVLSLNADCPTLADCKA